VTSYKGEDPDDLVQLQVLLLRLWFWKGLRRHGNLLHNVHMRRVRSTSVHRILKAVKWEVYIPRLLHAINDDDPDRRMQFCEWFQQMVNDDEEFVTKIVWSDEPFRLISRHPVVVPTSFPFAFLFLSLPCCPFPIGYPFGEREWGGQVVVSSWLLCNFGRVTLFLDSVYVTSSPAWLTGRFLRA